MADLIVRGGSPIAGTLRPSGAKNAVLPILCASLLARGETVLSNVPDISDVEKILTFFDSIGSSVKQDKSAGTISISHDAIDEEQVSTDLPSGIRSSVLLMAPIIHRFRKMTFDTDSKGCALGIREIDPHLEHLISFGCEIKEQRPYYVERKAKLIGASVWAEYASVTGTETFAMLGAVAKGKSVLINAASEPHVQALCEFLIKMGAEIDGVGTSRIELIGVEHLRGTSFRIPDDHHEVATFLAIGAATDGRISVETEIRPHMPLILKQFEKLGVEIVREETSLTVEGWSREVVTPLTSEMIPKIEAAPWPYFPADLLPQFIGLAVGLKSEVMFWNKVYEGALAWSSELAKFGAKTTLADPHRLIVFGSNQLRPATVEAPYIIRVVLGLFIAALQIKGESIIRNADPIKRAHPDFISKLCELGADVRWVE